MTRTTTIIAMLIGGLWGMDASAQFTELSRIYPPEIVQHPHSQGCALYTNRMTPLEQPDEESWVTPVGTVTFTFERGPGTVPDIVTATSVPEGYIVVPFAVKREEDETAEFCIMRFEGV